MEWFSTPYILCLLVSFLFAMGCGLFYKIPLESKYHVYFSKGIFWVVLINEIWWSLFRHFYLRVPLKDNLPLHISDFTFFILLLGMATKKRIFCDLAYISGTSSIIFGLFFPYFNESGWVLPISIIRYYLTHMAIFGGGIYLTIGRRYFPTFKSYIYASLITLCYSLITIPINFALETNYYYTAHPPPIALPKWVVNLPWVGWYGGAVLFFLIMFYIFWLPMYFLRKRKNFK